MQQGQFNFINSEKMLVGCSQEDMAQWNDDVHRYEKEKRTKKPFGRDFKPIVSIVRSQQIRQKERAFDPVLQTFTSRQKQTQAQVQESSKRNESLGHYFRSVGKHNTRDFDIINLSGSQMEPFHQNKWKVKAPVRNIYNPINNQPVPQFYYKNRDVRLPHEKEFKNIKPAARDFDIVTGNYYQDNEAKRAQELQKRDQSIQQKYLTSQKKYDAVMGRYHDANQQQQYQDRLAQSQIEQTTGQKYNRRFPPTYLSREPLILDSSKPLSQSLIDLELREANAKRRYKLKYLIEKEYEQRNIQHEEKREARLINRVHNSHALENKIKQFDLSQISSKKGDLENQIYGTNNNKVTRLESLYNPEYFRPGDINSSSQSNYNSSSRSSARRSSIKSGGFS